MTPYVETTLAIEIDCAQCKAKVGDRCEPEHPCKVRRADSPQITREANRAARSKS